MNSVSATDLRISSKGKLDLVRRLLSFRVMLAAGLAVIAFLTVSTRFHDPDMWFHMKLGQIVWETHSIPSTDIFSFTAAGHPWVAHEWLAEVAIYAAYEWGGYTGLMVWLSGLTSILLVLAYVLCYRVTGVALVAFLGALCTWFFATVGLSVRPLLLGHIFLVAELLFLELGRRNRRWFWCLPPLFALWVNCHGSYFFGMGVLFLYWICSFVGGRWGLIESEAWEPADRKTLGIVMVACGLALCVNPVGIKLLTYPLNTMFQQSVGVKVVEEWQPPELNSPLTIGILFSVIAVLLISLVRRSELRLRELLVLGAAFWLATQHARMAFVFGIVAAPVLCRMVAPFLGKDRERELPAANAFLMAAFAVAIVLAFPSRADLEEQVRKKTPQAAVQYIRSAGLQGPMLNEYVFGDYLIWAMPEHKVFIDGRGDVYDWTGVFAEFGRWATLAEDPNILLDKYKIHFCLLAKAAPLGRVLPYMGWRKAYSDEVASVFVR